MPGVDERGGYGVATPADICAGVDVPLNSAQPGSIYGLPAGGTGSGVIDGDGSTGTPVSTTAVGTADNASLSRRVPQFEQ